MPKSAIALAARQWLEPTLDAARHAGEIAMRHFCNGHATWEKGPGQIVTAADIEIDQMLFKALPKIAPAAWLSEETEDNSKRLQDSLVWIVDPIDGTRSFAAGKPEFTISIGLVEHGHPILGIVFNPAKDEMFEATLGYGAFRNGVALKANTNVSLEGGQIVVSHTENKRRRFSEMFPQAHVTEIGSLAYKLARVAAGDFDAYFSWRKAHDWDIAAAALMLSEAGALFSNANGDPIRLNEADPRHHGLIASSGPLHAQLVDQSIKKRRAD